MRNKADILTLGKNIRSAMAEIRTTLPVGIEPHVVADQSTIVDVAINDFLTSLYQAIGIILLCSFVSLGVRPGVVVALAIPITLAIVFTVMNVMHIDLQRVSLGALIIALTLLVDDAMTTVDAMQRRLAAGDVPDAAASFAYRTLAAPMLIGTLVTIASFVPVGFAPGGASEVLSSLFSVVAISLIASWLVAVVFGPIIGKALLKAPAPTQGEPKPSKLKNGYQALLRGAIRMRWVTIGITIALFVGAILALPLVPRQFFPSSDRPELLVDLTLRQNASIAASQATAERVEALLKGDPDVDHYSTYVGRGAIRFYLPLAVHLANPFFSQLVVITKSIEARERLQAKLEKVLAVELPEVVSRVSPLEMGPPVGWPLQYRVIGPDKDELRRIAEDVAKLMAADTRVRTVNFDWMEPARQLRVHIDQDEARRLRISTANIASVLQASITGTTITQVRDDIYLVNVVARATASERASFDTLASLQVATPSGRMVPLSQFARFSEEQEFPLVWRRDRVPTLTVRADVLKGVLPESVVAQIGPSIAEYNAKLPRPYRVETGGLYESSNDSSANVFSVVPMMILLMLLFMMILLISFRRLAMVVLILPLGLIGVVASLLLFGRPLGFVAILGILALIGMIAKNAVILIVSIEEERAAGHSVPDAVITAAGNRLTPIVLTAVSTVFGLIPIAPTIFWGPMAIAIMGGLMVASLLTLILLPVLYITIFGRDDKKSPPPAVPAAKPA
jgi:multidrug efflux pump